MKIKSLLIASGFAVANLTGCALTTDQIELQYTQQQGVSTFPGASNVSVQVKVSDQRPDKSKVSSKKNGFGMEMAPIIATEEVAVTVRKAIEQELRSRGFKIGADTALVQIGADLIRFYNDHKMGFFAGDAVAELNMTVTVKTSKGEQVYSKHVLAQGIEPNTQIMSGENARLALNRALENGMKSLFEDQAFLTALAGAAPIKSASK